MAGNNYTKHTVRGADYGQKNFDSLKKPALRRDGDRNIGYTNEVERLLKTGIPIMQHQFINPSNVTNPLLAFVSTESRPIDPKVGGTLGMTGWTTAYKEHGVDVGDHLVARVHAEIPEIVCNTYNLWCVRNTYSVRRKGKRWELPKDEVDKFYQRQLAAFSKSSENWLKFMGYLIFADMTAPLENNPPNNNGTKKYPFTLDERVINHNFEEYKRTIFSPTKKSADEQKEVPFCGLNLALEYVPIINPNHIVTENDHLTHASYIRKKLTERPVEGDASKLLFDHELPDIGRKLVAFKECIMLTSYDMTANPTTYRIAAPMKPVEGFELTVETSDLILIMNDLDSQMLEYAVPTIIKPSEHGGFTAESLGVGRIIKTRLFKPGEALIIHKDALKFIIVDNDVGNQANYNEPGVVNTGHSMGYYFDLFEMFPRCYIKPKSGSEIKYSTYTPNTTGAAA